MRDDFKCSAANCPQKTTSQSHLPHDREEVLRRAEVMKAYADGKKIQVKMCAGKGGWDDVTGTPLWDWHWHDYRVAPEPVRLWANIAPDGRIFTYTTTETARWSAFPGRFARVCVPFIEVLE